MEVLRLWWHLFNRISKGYFVVALGFAWVAFLFLGAATCFTFELLVLAVTAALFWIRHSWFCFLHSSVLSIDHQCGLSTYLMIAHLRCLPIHDEICAER